MTRIPCFPHSAPRQITILISTACIVHPNTFDLYYRIFIHPCLYMCVSYASTVVISFSRSLTFGNLTLANRVFEVINHEDNVICTNVSSFGWKSLRSKQTVAITCGKHSPTLFLHRCLGIVIRIITPSHLSAHGIEKEVCHKYS